eukprot:COSAG02_NODE_4395_length_5409_cov_3.368738_5_plen_44_part_00
MVCACNSQGYDNLWQLARCSVYTVSEAGISIEFKLSAQLNWLS